MCVLQILFLDCKSNEIFQFANKTVYSYYEFVD